MARPLRIEFGGAIYHVMSRGNARQAIFDGEGDYERLRDGLAQTVGRYGWEVLTFVFMPNHVHLFLRTPQPNLSRGMQYLLSGYANWFAKRHRRPGHLFQGRFKGELVEDETYFCGKQKGDIVIYVEIRMSPFHVPLMRSYGGRKPTIAASPEKASSGRVGITSPPRRQQWHARRPRGPDPLGQCGEFG